MKIRLGETVRLGLPQTSFRLNPRQVGLDSPLMPEIGLAQLLDACELTLFLVQIPRDSAIAGIEECQTAGGKGKGEPDEEDPRSAIGKIDAEPVAYPIRNRPVGRNAVAGAMARVSACNRDAGPGAPTGSAGRAAGLAQPVMDEFGREVGARAPRS